MNTKLLLAGVAAAAIALPAMAQAPAAMPVAPETPASTPAVNPDPSAVPAPATDAVSADTGTAANTSATAADLKTGATVTDASGASLGTISKVHKSKTGESQVTLSSEGKTVTVPTSSLSVSGGVLTSSDTKADVWGAPK